jgi:hypothetical protein
MSNGKTMRFSQRLIAATVLVSLSCALAGCGGGGVSSFDPMDMLDFLDTKKKLPGERKEVFPEGVPGVEQGVPKELYRGAQAQPDAPPVVEPPPAPEPRGRHAGRPSHAAPAPDADAAPAAPPAPKAAKRRKHVSPTAIPRDEPAPAPAPAAQTQTAPPPLQQQPPAFPAPLPSGSFQR